jgi:hypothetical protein
VYNVSRKKIVCCAVDRDCDWGFSQRIDSASLERTPHGDNSEDSFLENMFRLLENEILRIFEPETERDRIMETEREYVRDRD